MTKFLRIVHSDMPTQDRLHLVHNMLFGPDRPKEKPFKQLQDFLVVCAINGSAVH